MAVIVLSNSDMMPKVRRARAAVEVAIEVEVSNCTWILDMTPA